MQINKIIALHAVLFFSCFASSLEENNLASLGFYYSPDEIIKKLDNEKVGFKEHFLLGLSYKKIKDMKKAMYHFANSCFKYSRNTKLKLYAYPVYKYLNEFHIKSKYYDDSAYEIAQLFYEYREFEYVIKFIDLMKKSNSALFRDAVILKSNALMKLSKYKEAISFLSELIPLYDHIGSKSLIHIRIASAYEKENSNKEAIKEYFKIIQLDKESWHSGIACERILDISSKYKYDYNDEEKFLLGTSLYHNSKIESINILKALVKEKLKMPLFHEVLEYSIKAFVRAGQFNDADKLISQYINNPSLYYNLLKIKADELWSINKRKDAFNDYQILYKNAEDEILKESHKRIAEFLISKNSDYEEVLIKYINSYPEDRASEIFLWTLTKDRLRENDFDAAIKYLEESLSTFPHSPYSGRNRFWLAKLYSNSGRDEDAMRKYIEMVVINPDSAYTWKKLEELKDIYKTKELNDKFKDSIESQNEDALFSHTLLFIQERDFIRRDERIHALDFIGNVKKYNELNKLLKDPKFDTKIKDKLKGIEKYFIIGYYEGIIREIELIPENEFIIDKYCALGYYGARFNNYYFAITSISNLLKYYNIKENIAILSSSTIAKLFPFAFRDYVESLCSKWDIEKEMIYAVMKAESSFNHMAVSPAGAVGLMQLMPSTAKGIAKEMRLKEFDLKDPFISISFGLKYLFWLNKLFNGDFVKMMAGYNGGAANVKRWIKEIESQDDDFFIEYIPFQETRYYVLRTQRFYIQYQLINSASGL